ncbi:MULTISPECIES: hypothetical protein [Bacillus amyloliquefaciens group]|uniref:hypothetical protein n=1 Tax=Bacillus amyloliquefaciens group TaxID=1938374 RepID=UPI00097988CE|nr:hypothetical protein [Bacillus velezensis]MBC2599377.1 hypothetical protein [Bacillus velezensis]MBU5240467.1 hypothetical protein [Bacillus velezensis]POR13407.1 hypothetical protein B9W23_13990 [Bacillus velezensis]QCE17466.1 hypothetical protein SB21_03090 [Bacillus velezensis]
MCQLMAFDITMSDAQCRFFLPASPNYFTIIVLIGIVLSGLVSRAAKPPAHQKNVHDTNSHSM